MADQHSHSLEFRLMPRVNESDANHGKRGLLTRILVEDTPTGDHDARSAGRAEEWVGTPSRYPEFTC